MIFWPLSVYVDLPDIPDLPFDRTATKCGSGSDIPQPTTTYLDLPNFAPIEPPLRNSLGLEERSARVRDPAEILTVGCLAWGLLARPKAH